MVHDSIQEFKTKISRIHALMEKRGFDAVVIGTQTNFSWLTSGKYSRVLLTSDIAVAYLVITKTDRFVVSYTMDGPRNYEEELKGMEFEPIYLRWYEGSLEDKILSLLKQQKILSDVSLTGATVSMGEFYAIHYPLTEWEIERFREIDQNAEITLRKTVDIIKPGMMETEAESLIISEFVKNGYFPVVLLIGSDERNFKYRHVQPTSKKIDKYLLLIIAMRKYGLNAVLTRSVYFGDTIPGEIQQKFEAASTIAANCIAYSISGTRFADIFAMQKGLYNELGYPGEWKNHFQGGITGYVCNDSSLCLDTNTVMVSNQTYNWFITITGVNTEDTYLSRGSSGEVLTTTGAWPLKTYKSLNGKEINLPMILQK